MLVWKDGFFPDWKIPEVTFAFLVLKPKDSTYVHSGSHSEGPLATSESLLH
jgi:hypothetical protein